MHEYARLRHATPAATAVDVWCECWHCVAVPAQLRTALPGPSKAGAAAQNVAVLPTPGGQPAHLNMVEGSRRCHACVACPEADGEAGPGPGSLACHTRALQPPEPLIIQLTSFNSPKHLDTPPSTSTSPHQRQVIEDGNGNVKIKCPNANKDFAPEEISAQVRTDGRVVCRCRRVCAALM